MTIQVHNKKYPTHYQHGVHKVVVEERTHTDTSFAGLQEQLLFIYGNAFTEETITSSTEDYAQLGFKHLEVVHESFYITPSGYRSSKDLQHRLDGSTRSEHRLYRARTEGIELILTEPEIEDPDQLHTILAKAVQGKRNANFGNIL